MNIFLYFIIFALGCIFGSFLTLATYRIPLNKDITHEHSFCPNCNHKLTFFDLIPILSYLFLGGKCRYCKKKISPRYFIIEVLTGISFIILALFIRIDIYTIATYQIIEFFIGILYIVFLFLIAGIDVEHREIDKRVLIYGITISCINIMYQYIYCTVNGQKYNLNRIVLYLICVIVLIIINIELIQKSKKYDYCIDLVTTSIIMSLFTYEITTILSIMICLSTIGIRLLLNKLFNNKKKKNKKKKTLTKMPIAFYLVASNMIVLLVSFFYTTNVF